MKTFIVVLSLILLGSGQANAVTFITPAAGGLPIGRIEIKLDDPVSYDLFRPAQPRSIMITAWYPAMDSSKALSKYATSTLAHDDVLADRISAFLGSSSNASMQNKTSHARDNIIPLPGKKPTLLYSHGLGTTRVMGTALIEQLVSVGYIVISIDHTYEAAAVEFPAGMILGDTIPFNQTTQTYDQTYMQKAIDQRVLDVKSVLNNLETLSIVGDYIDTDKIGMLGHSYGGYTAAEAMYEDSRIKAGVNLDGSVGWYNDSPVELNGLDRPYMLLSGPLSDNGVINSGAEHPSWISFNEQTTGWFKTFYIDNIAHYGFTDAGFLLINSTQRINQCGSLAPADALKIIAAYATSFFNRFLLDSNDGLLDDPGNIYPETREGY